MIILSKRDKAMLKFIEKYGGITTKQARDLFFDGLHPSTIRRLCKLEKANMLKGYRVDKQKVYIFPDSRKLTAHDIGILDFLLWIHNHMGQVIDFQKEPRFINGTLRPDALVKFTMPYKNKLATVCVLLEYDLTHYTEMEKLIVWYEKLYREQHISEYCGDLEFPIIVIARQTNGVRYNSNNFNIVYCKLDYSDLYELLFV